MNWLAQRLDDWRREQRIRDLRSRMSASFAVLDSQSVRDLAHKMFAECDARSPGQVARMERRLFRDMDEHAQQVFLRVKKQ